MNLSDPFTILSADKANLSDAENAQRTEFLARQLQHEHITSIPLRGRYVGTPEHAVLVFDTDEQTDAAVHRLARAYDQETLLHVDSARQSYLENLSTGDTCELGQFREVSEDVAATLPGVTETSDGRFFAAVAA